MLKLTIVKVAAVCSGLLALNGQPLEVDHAECVYFGPKHDKFAFAGLKTKSDITAAVVRGLSYRSAAISPAGDAPDMIDRHIFAALREANVGPAPRTNDYEFIRRVTLDLTGRIPTADRVLSFAADSSADKRSKLIDELLSAPEWVDKWTMYFGDLFRNTDRNTQINRYEQGRNAFYSWIRESLAANKPYDQMARELISAQGINSWEPGQGAINWLIGGRVTGGPPQDIFDQQASEVAETFLGLGNLNCVLCHNGRGHLDSLNLWAANATRYQAWQLAAYFSRTSMRNTRPNPQMNISYWSLEDNTQYRTDYALGTTTGNRPGRAIIGGERTVAPVYFFNGNAPTRGENYRVALARELTSDFQFARAAVNYVWKEFFGRGIVEPANQFDPARLDPDNPPPAPWALQPSNARLLNALARDFIDAKFDLKALLRQITNSQAYQLSARYQGEWNPAWEPLFARKLVRRLWAEEVHDAIAQSSNLLPAYNINMSTSLEPNLVRVNWAMRLPQTARLPGGAAAAFLDAFLRGNRDDQERSAEGSIPQSLALKNDAFVMTRIRATGNSLLAQKVKLPNEQLVDSLFLAVLSRHPSETEMSTALAALASGDRTKAAEDLLWTLYNKLDFIYNY